VIAMRPRAAWLALFSGGLNRLRAIVVGSVALGMCPQPVKALMPGQSPYHELDAKLCSVAGRINRTNIRIIPMQHRRVSFPLASTETCCWYIEFVDAVWIPEHSEDYFRSRDPLALPPSRRAFYCLKYCLICPAPDRHLRAEIV
jgi:hypothetical protein